MEEQICILQPLLEKTEEYSKTSLKLLKLKFVDKTADFSSMVLTRLIILCVILFFALVLNIAAGLWLGDLFGKNYLGFLTLSAFYGLSAITLLIIYPQIKDRVNNRIIKNALN
ncbi:MAG TPA: hypothetical protein VNZ49_09680 [Bacteroidia bacterium]|jgi:hypothetical protein|nr:hypothetical protein [Bacteroidia bacterium]